MFLRVMEYVVASLVALFLVVQVVIPAWRGQRLFPLFRRQGRLEKELADLAQAREEDKLDQALHPPPEPEPESVNVKPIKSAKKRKPRS